MNSFHPERFEATRWSLILRARDEDTIQRKQALEELCQSYWYPLYAFLRRNGRGVEDAQDLTQDFFARLLNGALLSGANPSKGRFRTLLLSALRNMDVNAWKAASAQKRGGGAQLLSLDNELTEERWQADATLGGNPEVAFDRAWANTVMDRASSNLHAEFVSAGKGELFAELFPRLNGSGAEDGLAEAGARLGMTEAAVKMAFSRMRRKFADAMRAEIAHTVGSQDDIQDELRYLLGIFL
jgi:RNA polymerase sigma factor (sigma-70 family)